MTSNESTAAALRAHELREQHGSDWDAVLDALKAEGCSPADAMLATMDVLDVDFGIARRIVLHSPVWPGLAEANEHNVRALAEALADPRSEP